MDRIHATTTSGSDVRDPRILDAPELTFNVENELERLRAESGYSEFGRTSITLARSGPLRVVLTAAREQVEIGAFEADGPVLVQVLEGTVTDPGGGVRYGAGSLIWFSKGGAWSIRADSDAALLLSVANPDAGPEMRP